LNAPVFVNRASARSGERPAESSHRSARIIGERAGFGLGILLQRHSPHPDFESAILAMAAVVVIMAELIGGATRSEPAAGGGVQES
jgi:hypothetical protein